MSCSNVPSVLVVDDNPGNLYAIVRILSGEGYDVREARTGQEALIEVRKHPDVVILDVNLPDLDGLEVCRLIKTNPSTNALPIIQMSASFVSKDDWAAGLESGADSYLIQPVDPAVLAATVRAMLRMRQAEAEARRTAIEWETTFKAVREGLCLLDAEGRVRRCNQAAAAILQASVEDLVGRQYQELAAMSVDADLARIHRILAHLGEGESREVVVGARWVRVTSDPITDELGKLVGSVQVIADITERKLAGDQVKKLNRELVQRAAELSSINRELEAFSYSVSHDLRAPLRSIKGFTQRILDEHSGQLDEQGKHYFDRVRTAAKRMGALIDDLLTLSGVTRGELQWAEVNLTSVVESVAAELKTRDPDRVVELRIQRDVAAYGDARLLRVVMENLIGNAWKFTCKRDAGTIEFWQIVVDGETCYCVRDNGAGFDMTYVSKLFGAFQRLHGADEYPGSGIGLATVQRIINRHGGRIWAESIEGQGASFYFTLRSQ